MMPASRTKESEMTFDLEYSLEELNLTAIAMLRQGNVVGSLSILRRAMLVARASKSDKEHCSSQRYQLKVTRLHHVFGTLQETKGTEASSLNDFDAFTGVFAVIKPQELFGGGISEHDESPAPSTESPKMDRVEILVLLYNFAFALQMSGGDSSLIKAMRLYKLAHECARSIRLDEHPELYTLILALTTNLGHIHSCFFQQAEVHAIHNRMEDLLSTMSSASLLPQDSFFFEQAAFSSGFAHTKLPPAA
mmetsp:Transcript_27532/g.57610  ORF Transcript_27532/g.57610 Transcript_27532/m.57610 type:complete len:249 (-) Transcript_27532:233-979(-)